MNKPFVCVIAWRKEGGYHILITEVRGGDFVIEKDVSFEEWQDITKAFHSNTSYEGRLINTIQIQSEFSSLIIGGVPDG